MAEEKQARPHTGRISHADRVHKDLYKPKRIAEECKNPEITIRPEDGTKQRYRCCMCGKSYVAQKNNFYTGGSSYFWGGNNGYLPFCKTCCDILFDNLVEFYSGNEEHALKHLCCMFGWYYSEQASTMMRKDSRSGTSRVGLYASKMHMPQVVRYGTNYFHTVKDEVADLSRINDVDNLPDEEEGEEEFAVTRQLVHKWGRGFTPDQYQYLEEEYQDWITRNVCNTKAQEELFQNICLAQLDVRTARQTGGDVDKAQKALQNFMNSANILPKQTADNLLADTQTFGTLLKKFEETRPVPEPDPSWKDVDGIRRYMNTWFRGGLAKALKVKNDNALLYDEAVEEMQKYTVEPVKLANSDSGNDTSIFDQNGGDEGDQP